MDLEAFSHLRSLVTRSQLRFHSFLVRFVRATAIWWVCFALFHIIRLSTSVSLSSLLIPLVAAFIVCSGMVLAAMNNSWRESDDMTPLLREAVEHSGSCDVEALLEALPHADRPLRRMIAAKLANILRADEGRAIEELDSAHCRLLRSSLEEQARADPRESDRTVVLALLRVVCSLGGRADARCIRNVLGQARQRNDFEMAEWATLCLSQIGTTVGSAGILAGDAITGQEQTRIKRGRQRGE